MILYTKINSEVIVMFINNQGLLTTPNPDKITCETAVCNITNCGHQYMTEPFTAEHKIIRNDMKLLYVVKGPVINERCNIKSTISAGHLIYYKPQENTTTYFFSPETEVYWIHFYGENFSHIINKLFQKNNYYLDIGVNKKYINLFDRIINHLRFSQTNANFVCSGMLMQILGDVYEKKSMVGNSQFEKIKQTVEYIDNNYNKTITNKELAAIANLSESFFYKSFKNIMNSTPYSYQTSLRLNVAAEYLECTSLPIKEISEKVGYDDPFSFSRCFRLKFGISPRAYRNNNC